MAIPLRNPVDTVTSWRARGRDLDDLWPRYGLLVNYVQSRLESVGKGKRIQLYKVEDLPYRVGERPQSREIPPRISKKYVDGLLSDEIKEFYRKYGGYEV